MIDFGTILAAMGAIGAFYFVLFNRHKPSEWLSPHYRIVDFLRSADVPKLQRYRLRENEFDNLKILVDRVFEPMTNRFGRPTITSGGRPQSVADFVTLLRKKGYHAVDNSQHNDFAAADFTYGSPVLDRAAYVYLQHIPEVLQLILTEKAGKSYIHVSIYDPSRPNLPKVRRVDVDE